MSQNPFNLNPDAGIAPNLLVTPPADMPQAPEAGDATATLSPFIEAQDVDSIIAQLSLDRPLPLHIPNREKYIGYQFHIINDNTHEHAAATRRGFRPVTDPDLLKLFEGKVAGTDKDGKIMKPVLMARERRIGDVEDAKKRQKLAEQNRGLDPRNKTFNSKYADDQNAVHNQGVTKAKFEGAGMGNIRVR